MNLLISIAVNLLLMAFFFIFITKRMERRFSTEIVLEDVRKEVEGIIVELNGTTDRNIALVEDRIQSLGEILRNADKKIEVLNRESRRKVISDFRYNDIQKRNPPAEQAGGHEQKGEVKKPGEDEERKSRIRELYRQGISAGLIAKKTGLSQGEVDLYISLIEK
jgi:DNA-binding NarL/FixJ family response regulator